MQEWETVKEALREGVRRAGLPPEVMAPETVERAPEGPGLRGHAGVALLLACGAGVGGEIGEAAEAFTRALEARPGDLEGAARRVCRMVVRGDRTLFARVRALVDTYPEVRACGTAAGRFAGQPELNRLLVWEVAGWGHAYAELWRRAPRCSLRAAAVAGSRLRGVLASAFRADAPTEGFPLA